MFKTILDFYSVNGSFKMSMLMSRRRRENYTEQYFFAQGGRATFLNRSKKKEKKNNALVSNIIYGSVFIKTGQFAVVKKNKL